MKTTLLALNLCLASGGIYLSQQMLFPHLKKKEQQSISYLPQEEYIRFLSLGENETAAGLMWIQSVSYFGESVLEDNNPKWLNDIYQLINTLDPLIESTYRFATLTKKIDYSDLKEWVPKGLKVHKDNWQLHLFWALLLIEKERDYSTAIALMKTQKDNPKAPEFIKNLWKSLESKEKLQTTKFATLVDQIIQNSGLFKRQLLTNLSKYLKSIDITDIDTKSILQHLEQKESPSFDYVLSVFQKAIMTKNADASEL